MLTAIEEHFTSGANNIPAFRKSPTDGIDAPEEHEVCCATPVVEFDIGTEEPCGAWDLEEHVRPKQRGDSIKLINGKGFRIRKGACQMKNNEAIPKPKNPHL